MATQGDGQRIRRGAAHWRALLSRHAASGLGVLAFCRREAVSAASFYRWRARLGGGDGGATSAARAAPAFVEVGALGSAAAGVDGCQKPRIFAAEPGERVAARVIGRWFGRSGQVD